MRRFTGVALAAAVATFAIPRPVSAWGFAAHRMVNRKAIDTLPRPLRTLFEGNAAYLSEHAIDPDLWQAAGREGEGPNHYLDLDAFGAPPSSDIPLEEAEHLRKHGPEAGERGRVPWRVGEVYEELVAAFRARDAGRALERAAILGHYVGDAHVPLHAVLNYNGQLTGQVGIHSRWESELVDRFAVQVESALAPRPALAARRPVPVVFASLRESFREAPSVLESDVACRGARDLAGTPEDERYGNAYYSRLYSREAARLVARLSASATATGSLWLSAWEEAGRPALDPGFRFAYVRKATRAVLVSLDGSSSLVLDDAVARGLMPHLSRLRTSGATARGSLTALPAKTASGHAALFTGAWGDRNGIGGNWVQVPEASVLEMATGFSSAPLRAEPLWAAAARQGLDVTVASATQTFPWGPYLEERRFGGSFGNRLTLVDGYQNLDTAEAVYRSSDLTLRPAAGWGDLVPVREGAGRELDLEVAGVKVEGMLFDDPADPIVGFDSLYLALDKHAKDGITLKPIPSGRQDGFAGLTVSIAGARGAAFFRLFALDPDGQDLLLYRAPLHLSRSSRGSLEAPLYEATGGFAGNGAGRAYEEGRLGPPLGRGGDGTAEERYLETVALVLRQFARLDDFVQARTAWDLFVTYRPYPDEALHVWYGILDSSLAGHDPVLAGRLRPYLDRVLRMVDDSLGPIVRRAGADTVIAVGGDHGMVGANRVVRPNVALARAGVVGLDANGAVDLTRTRAIYFPGNSGYVLLNRKGRPGGIVGPEEEDQVRTEIEASLGSLRDPETGTTVVRGLIDARSASGAPLLGGPTGGDLYLSLAPGYDVSAALHGPLVEAVRPRGVHLLDAERPEMLVGFTIAGPGVAAGADLGRIRQVDIAPTVAAILGIDPPAHAVGRVLTEILRGRNQPGVPRESE